MSINLNPIKERPFHFIALLAFFVGFPLISWYYLKSGFDYQVSIIKEIEVKDSTTLDILAMGDEDIEEFLSNKVLLAAFPKEEAAFSEFMKLYRESQKQFGDRNDLLLVVYANSSLDTASLRIAVNTVRRPEEIAIYSVDDAKYNELNDALSLQDFPESNLVLIDIETRIRNYYNYSNKEDLAKLGGHIPKVFPFIPSPDFEYQPSTEK